MPRWHRTGWLLALTIVLATGCSGPVTKLNEREPGAETTQVAPPEGGERGLSDNKSTADEAAPAAPPRAKAAANQSPGGAQGQTEKAPEATAGHYIIRSAQVTLQVKDVRQAMAAVQKAARAQHGFVSDSNLQAAEGQTPSATLTLRVPAVHFDEVLDSLGGVGEVRARSVSGEDVTAEFVDTTSRVRNLQREEAELLKLLDRAGRLTDVLEVERELARVRGEIESAQGRLRQLGSQVDLATIQVTLSEAVQVTSTSPWQLGPVWENAWANAQRELAGTVAWLIAGLVWLVAYVLPVGIPVLLLFLLVGWAIRRLVVDKKQWLDPVMYDRLWAASAVVLLAIAIPALWGVIALVALIAVLAWAGSGVVRGLQRRSAYKD